MKTYDYINRVVLTLPLTVHEGTWTNTLPSRCYIITMILCVRRKFFEITTSPTLLASLEALDETSALVARLESRHDTTCEEATRHDTTCEEATSTSGLKKKGGCNVEPPPQINNECIEKALTQLKGAVMEVGIFSNVSLWFLFSLVLLY